MPIEELKIIGNFDLQRFPQFNPEDAAGWYVVPNADGKKKQAMYPTLGRKHIRFFNQNQLQFNAEPRGLFKTNIFMYVIVQNKIFRVDGNFNKIEITNNLFPSFEGNVYFTFLVAATVTFAIFTDGQAIYVYREDTGVFSVITDPLAPKLPLFIATFGNRLVVSSLGSSQFSLSIINLGGGNYDPAKAFGSGPGGPGAVFAQEDGVIGQMAVLHNTLYIFTPFTTGIWQNNPSVFSGTGTIFPFTKNKTIAFDFGIADPLSLDVDFNMMVWLARNRGGLVQVMGTTGQTPELMSTKAVDILLQNAATQAANAGLAIVPAVGFIYSYENTIFYRIAFGNYDSSQTTELALDTFSLEFNFDSKTWNRVIEADDERNRAQRSVYFNHRHLITVQKESTVYEMSGQFYVNELRNINQPDPQALDAYIAYPMRYERITPIIHEDDYSEFETEYVEIDFVFGDQQFVRVIGGSFNNAVFIVSESLASPPINIFIVEEGKPDNDPTYIITENSNFPTLSDSIYDSLFKPHLELYFSDDGGVSYHSADVREFSQLGVYQWKIRWYQLGCSRNRVYKLVAVAPSPIVVLGGVMVKRRVSGGAN